MVVVHKVSDSYARHSKRCAHITASLIDSKGHDEKIREKATANRRLALGPAGLGGLARDTGPLFGSEFV